VLNESAVEVFLGDLPDFLDAESVRLYVLALAQVELGNHFLLEEEKYI
jgi:hypothetical protein